MSVYVRPLRSNELYHHGILGMKWGVRRYQNEDGSLTPAGRRRLANISTFKGRYADEKKEMISKAMTSEQRERLKAAHDAYNRAGDEAKKAGERLDAELERRVRQKYGDAYKKHLHSWDPEWSKVLKDNPKDAKTEDTYVEAYHAYKKEGERIAKELLGKYANWFVLNDYTKPNAKAYEELTTHILREVENVHLK